MKSAIQKQRVSLTMEALEKRCVPAGNVTVLSTGLGGGLSIIGDAQNNDIRIVGGEGGSLYISSGDDATTINYGTSETVPRPGGISVDLGSGDDRLWMSNFSTVGYEFIRSGDGDDTIILRDLFLGGIFFDSQATIDSGNVNDLVDIGSVFAWSLNILSGPGDDVITLANLDVSSLYSLAGLRIDSGNGNDLISIDSTNAVALHLDAGNGTDQVRISGAGYYYGELSVNMGNGDDVLEFEDGAKIFATFGELDGGNGHDFVLGTSGLFYFPSANIFFEEVVL